MGVARAGRRHGGRGRERDSAKAHRAPLRRALLQGLQPVGLGERPLGPPGVAAVLRVKAWLAARGAKQGAEQGRALTGRGGGAHSW